MPEVLARTFLNASLEVNRRTARLRDGDLSAAAKSLSSLMITFETGSCG